VPAMRDVSMRGNESRPGSAHSDYMNNESIAVEVTTLTERPGLLILSRTRIAKCF
jgi:hypothetical protein